jgi:RimJ/RimL family protein N-acetyltransferase
MNPVPVVLYGEQIRLEPLDQAHVADLLEAAQDEAIWRYLPDPCPRTTADMAAIVDRAWNAAALGNELPFAIIRSSDDRAVGSTRFLEIRRADRALEIGWTWLGLAAQRTGINTEAKLLLCTHAFEDLGARRVQFKTDLRNLQSQRAIERLGAVKEGVLRRHRLMWDGFVRDTVYYSILDSEWPAVKLQLQAPSARASGSA